MIRRTVKMRNEPIPQMNAEKRAKGLSREEDIGK
jgi:hypothetical protein